MALEINKSTTVNGTIMIDNEVVMTLTTNINEIGNSYSNSNIINTALYEKNKKQVRTEKAEFEDYIYSLEDENAKGEVK